MILKLLFLIYLLCYSVINSEPIADPSLGPTSQLTFTANNNINKNKNIITSFLTNNVNIVSDNSTTTPPPPPPPTTTTTTVTTPTVPNITEIHHHIGDLSVKDRKHGKCGVNFKCVISYALYGNNPRYTVGAIRNTILAKEVFEGWIVRFYYDPNTVPAELLTDLKNLGAELIIFENKSFLGGMFARFFVSEDNTVDRYIIRDSDSRLSLREKAAVDAWIHSGYAIHSIRDHPSHCRPMNGGLWGGTKGAIKNMKELANKYKQNRYNDDQNFLTSVIWPLIKDNQISHDSACCEMFPNAHPFPTRRIGWEHIGSVISDQEAPRAGDTGIFLAYKDSQNPKPWFAPLKCRLHPDWTHG